MKWLPIKTPMKPVPRLSHTSTQVGSYLFIFGGHNGAKYLNELNLLNLVTMSFEGCKIQGDVPIGRGYTAGCLVDGRIFYYGGYDGRNIFDDLYVLELSSQAYLPQITKFEIMLDD
eukprot:NODE_99_length_20465_cov_0.827654.p20 type:complete len:116 gc:universal NODE_99_length_20465_cov_0.827654:9967-9620(-)